ncbi:raftlin isoform X1 [Girardinichthys multiradiatus]|uniref:raftlin isoform X1 n=1 Tax=Girardinichthys multiradiatus TaxID=208333 RepID=UPI001FAE3030|nr:raftlin isoform X1 [Girardinichthys multiradiatus]
MGCRLPKLRKAEERRSPGNIYSTLRRPQVETKVGVAYTYHFLDFLLGKEEVPVSSVLCLSSIRELPVQVRELYAQGFVLVAVHPFVHPCGPRHAHIQRQLHRAVLVRETQSPEKSQLWSARNRLETEVCVASQQAADPEAIQNYVKKIQDVAEQGVMFVGFLQQPGGGPYFLGHWDADELSSLHSSPSPIHRQPFSTNTSPTGPNPNGEDADLCCCESLEMDHESVEKDKQDLNLSVSRKPDFSLLKHTVNVPHNPEELGNKIITSQTGSKDFHKPRGHIKPDSHNAADVQGKWSGLSQPETAVTTRLQECKLQEIKQHFTASREKHLNLSKQRETRVSSPDSWLSSPELDRNHDRRSDSTHADGQRRVTTQNNNHIRLKNSGNDMGSTSPPAQARMQLFALYNHTEEPDTSLRFYSLRVPLHVQKEAEAITDVDANWLDHMTQHFSSGAQLIDGFFHLTDEHDSGVSSVDSIFIFQSSAEETTDTSYDAIVVEQWTVIDGVVVKTDYIPLLQSLAPYGWKLMCVLPTPIVRTNRYQPIHNYNDGSLSTKQILFLQRPILQRRRKDFKMLNLRGRSKAKKHSAGEALDEQENKSLVIETEMDRLRINEEEEEAEAEGRKRGDRGKSKRVSLQKTREDALHQKAFSFLLERRASVEHQEEETDVDAIPLPRQEKAVRWTDFCPGDERGLKEKVRMEERIKQQLFSGVC